MNSKNAELSHLKEASQCTHAIRNADHFVNQQDWQRARDQFTEALRYADLASSLHYQKSRCFYQLGDYYETIAEAGKLLKLDPHHLEGLEMRGRAYYQLGEYDAALNHYRQGLRLDPEHKGCKEGHKQLRQVQSLQSKAGKFWEKKDYMKALTQWQSLLELEPTHPLISLQALLQIARCHQSMKHWKEGLEKAKEACQRQDKSVLGHYLWAQLAVELEEWEVAVQQFKQAQELLSQNQGVPNEEQVSGMSLPTTQKLEEEIRKAEARLKQSQQKDYYKILGVSRQATNKEIKKAYREKALQWHPDKHPDEEDKVKAEKQFQLIAEAYEVLSDDEKRKKYDVGEEVFPNQGGGGGGAGGHGGFPFQHGNPFDHFARGFGGGGQQFHFSFG